MDSNFSECGDCTYLDGEGSVDPTTEELKELHSAKELNRWRSDHTEHARRAKRKSRNRRRNKLARKSRRNK